MDSPMLEPPPPARRGLLRRSWPWLVGVTILVVVAMRIPLDEFRVAVGQGPHLTLAAFNLCLIVATLFTDSIATWIGLRAITMRRPFDEILFVRGATYVLFLVHYALGQGGFGYYLHRTGVPPLRAVGATLFLMGTNFAAMLLVTTAACALHGPAAYPTLWWSLVALDLALVVYLAIIVWKPDWLARRQLFAPLFEARLRGHAVAVVGRLPHTAAIVLGHWIAIRAWGIPVPFEVGMALMPAVAIIAVLPISPGGLGTMQAAFVLFFSGYAAGATADARDAAVFAFGIVYFVYGVVSSLIVGLACAPFARRVAALRAPQAPSAKT